jgi:ectoine hydroxylase-related dioxygenase (phytanoyl-CoA dioxygenase family)
MTRIEELGFAIVPDVLDEREIVRLETAIGRDHMESGRGGLRNLLDRAPEVAALADSPTIRRLVEPVLGSSGVVARGILFDKTPEANWKVPWHQDLTIAVQCKIETQGYGPWTMKENVHHVQPPVEVIEKMLAVRIHLDDCGEENGPLKVIPGTHRMGRLSAGRIQSMQQSMPVERCVVKRGDAILMRPLLLHSSSAAESPAHRRVIHLEYASSDLPNGLRWLSR